MGHLKLLILLGLVVGALYSLHLLAQDYQKIFGARFLIAPLTSLITRGRLFKREISSNNEEYQFPKVRWKMYLQHDRMKCAQSLFCQVGQMDETEYNTMEQVFAFMLRLKREEEEIQAYRVFLRAFEYGRNSTNSSECRYQFPSCPFSLRALLKIINFFVVTPESSFQT